MSRARRVDVGFTGGQVLSVRASVEEYQGLLSALDAGDRGRWHRMRTEDSELLIDLPQVCYVRLDTDEHRVGF